MAVPATTSAKLWARAGGQQGFETAIIERCGRRESPVEEALIEMRLEGVSVRGSRTLPKPYSQRVLPAKAKLAGPQALWVKEPGKPDEL